MCQHAIDIDKDEGTSQGDANGKVCDEQCICRISENYGQVDNNTNNANNTSNANINSEVDNNTNNANNTSNANTNSEVDNNTNANNTSNANTNSEVDNNTTVQIKKNRNNNATNNANNTTDANINNTNNTNNANINNTNNTNSEEREKEPGKFIVVLYKYIDVLYKYMIFNAELPKEQNEKKGVIKRWTSLAHGFALGTVPVTLAIVAWKFYLAANHEKLNIPIYISAILVVLAFAFSLLIFLAVQFMPHDDILIKTTRILGALLLLTVILFVIGAVICIFFITPKVEINKQA